MNNCIKCGKKVSTLLWFLNRLGDCRIEIRHEGDGPEPDARCYVHLPAASRIGPARPMVP